MDDVNMGNMLYGFGCKSCINFMFLIEIRMKIG